MTFLVKENGKKCMPCSIIFSKTLQTEITSIVTKVFSSHFNSVLNGLKGSRRYLSCSTSMQNPGKQNYENNVNL